MPTPTPYVTPDETQIVTRWPHSRRSVPLARRELAAALDAWELPALRDAASLVLSELVTNAIRHARRPAGHLIETRLVRLPGERIRIEVHDASTERPEMRGSSETDEGGRGLLMVDVVTGHQWGVSSRPGIGKAVWAVVGPQPEPGTAR